MAIKKRYFSTCKLGAHEPANKKLLSAVATQDATGHVETVSFGYIVQNADIEDTKNCEMLKYPALDIISKLLS